MTLDSPAIVAVVCREAGFEVLLGKMARARVIIIGAPTLAETNVVLTLKLGHDAGAVVDQFLAEIQALVVPFTREHLSAFCEAFLRYGKGRHPARLNLGDCVTYAIAKVSGMPVLFTGGDFTLTDLLAA